MRIQNSFLGLLLPPLAASALSSRMRLNTNSFPPPDSGFVEDFPRQSTQWPYPKSGVVPPIDPTKSAYACIIATDPSIDPKFAAENDASKVIDLAWGYLRNELAQTPCTGGNMISRVDIKADPSVTGPNPLGPNMNEWYKLDYDGSQTITITAKSVWGARHGLQTLENMLEIYNPGASDRKLGVTYVRKTDGSSRLILPYGKFTIEDEPRLSYRGFHLDTARHYISWANLAEIVTEMGRSKLNVFHWHATDDQSFPLVMKNSARLIHGPTCYETKTGCAGAFTDAQIYHEDDIIEFIKLAKSHGVRVVLEVDQPAHARSWASYNPSLRECDKLEHQVNGFCVEPICGILALNTKFDQVLEVGKAIVEDVDNLIEKGELFHLGMDEIGASCWGEEKRDQLTMRWLKEIADVVKPTGHQIAVWQDGLHSTHAPLPDAAKDVMVQVWLDVDEAQSVLNKGNDIIWSPYTSMYLDCGRGNPALATHGTWCDPYHSWWAIYKEAPDLLLTTNSSTGRVLGGETPLWAEQVDDTTVGPLLFPRVHAWGGAAWEPRTENVIDPSAEDPNSQKSIDRLLNAQEQLRRLNQLTRLGGVPAMDSQTAWCMYQSQEYCDHYTLSYWQYDPSSGGGGSEGVSAQLTMGISVTLGVAVALSVY